MPGNQFGHCFRISTWGESHGPAVGVVIDGCPPGLAVDEALIQVELDRRRPGQSDLTTPRKEADQVEILSGVAEGLTLGTPISLLVRNTNTKSRDYEKMREAYRPSHADYTYDAKYGLRAWQGGGRASARETVGRVAAAAIARAWLKQTHGIEIIAAVRSIHQLTANFDLNEITPAQVEANAVRCPDPQTAEAMAEAIRQAQSSGDTLGGVIECIARGVPTGWGDPVFDKLEANLAKAQLSIPASKGFEIGSGFAATLMKGSEHNDAFYSDEQTIHTRTNHSGGIQGGISNGEAIIQRVAFKPVSTIMQPQETVTPDGEATTLRGRGRHDACVLPRAVPIVEAMTALVLIDHALAQRAQCGVQDV